MAYVYRHIRLDKNEPFYIGIANEDSYTYKRAFNFNHQHRNNYWNNIYNKTEIEVEILFDNITFELAKEKEIEFIDLYKRTIDGGTLVNLTKGGEGVLGIKNTKITQNRFDWTGKTHSEKTKKLMSELGKGRKFTEKHKQNLSLGKRGQNAGDKNPMFGKLGVNNKNFKGYIEAYKDGVLFGTYEGYRDVYEKLGVYTSNLCEVLKGRRKSAKGFIFKKA